MGQPLHFAVADDESASRILIERILGNSFPGCSITQCRDGEQVLKLLDQARPSLVITDFNMPHSSGARLLLALRHREPRVPVVVISNSDRCRMASLEAGADFFLNKGDLFDLPRVVERLVPAEASRA